MQTRLAKEVDVNKSILNEAFFESLGTSILDVNEAQMLPPACYVSQEFFEFEKRAIFDHEWLCVGREHWAQNPGDYFTSSHIEEPIVVMRGNDRVLRAFGNVCQHRGMIVAEGRGSVKSLICQYHHWAYGLDGKLVGAPAMERAKGFNKSCIGLPEIKLEIWLGFVFINFNANASPLAPRLQHLTTAIANYHVETAEGVPPDEPTRLPWNRRLSCEQAARGPVARRSAKPIERVPRPARRCRRLFPVQWHASQGRWLQPDPQGSVARVP
jgi:phenylpropionate dioxygenase-like ring-hydroxylating dioxygenase large terminal subunit